MHHRSDGPDYGIVLKDTYVCQRGQRVHKLTRWRNRLRADFLHPAWIVKGQWEEAFSKRKKLNYSEVCTMEGIGNVKAAVTTCLLSTSEPTLPCRHITSFLCALWETNRIFSRRRSICNIMRTFDSNLPGFQTKSSIQHTNNHGHMHTCSAFPATLSRLSLREVLYILHTNTL